MVFIEKQIENAADREINNLAMTRKNHLDAWDFTVVAIYFVIIISTGLFAMTRANRSTVHGYFLAGRYMKWPLIGASIFASNIGSEHFIGLAGSGAAAGISVGAFEINAFLILQLCGWVFLPVFIASKVTTLPGYISKRFGGSRIQVYLAVLGMLLYIFTKISVNLFSGAIFIQLTIGWNLYLSIILLLGITSICTITGGLSAVMWIETVQTFIMIFGSSILTVLSVREIGGIQNLYHKYMNAIPVNVPANLTQCAKPDPSSFMLLRSIGDHNLPWLGFILGQTPVSIWYWCTDQMMVQRLLAAKSLPHSQGGTLFAGYLKILPFFLIILPGMISRILFVEEVACVDPSLCQSYCAQNTCTNTAYPKLVLGVLPSPLRGLIMSVMLSALMNDLSSVFNSSSTLFTCDIWPRFRKNASVMELMIVGRAFVVVMIGISIAWVPIIQSMQNGQMYLYIQDVSSNLAPPIAAVYIMAVLFKRVNEPGAFWSLMVGLVFGLLRMILNIYYTDPGCGHIDDRPFIIRIHYMYYAIFLFWITVGTCFLISYLTEPPQKHLLIRTTFWSRNDLSERPDEKVTNDISEIKNDCDKNMNAQESIVVTGEQEEETRTVDKHPGKLKLFITWFCGIKSIDNDENGQKQPSTQEDLEKDNSFITKPSRINQTIIWVLLIIICSLAMFLFIFFSIPKWPQWTFPDFKNNSIHLTQEL